MRDYWLSKLFFEVQDPAVAAEYRADRGKVLDRYPLKPHIRAAVLADDTKTLAPLVNPYLLRFYFGAAGMSDEQFMKGLRGSAAKQNERHDG